MNRRVTDIRKLMNAGFYVEPINESVHECVVNFNGPPDSLYSGGVWKVYVELLDTYPEESPLIYFVTPIYHPNIYLRSGIICVNMLDDDWNSAFDLVTVFEYILPQLLVEPNASEPLNKDAGKLLIEDRSAYEEKVKEVRDQYAKPKDDVEESGDEEPNEDGKNSED